METTRVDRRLAAVLAADVVGYSRLIERDEAGTLERLKTLRKGVVEPILARHAGRTVKLMGDGALVEFPSASAAVEAAAEVQQAVERHERERPEAERLRLRIGVSLGDVVHEDGDIFGEGVNLAARLEQLAEPGGVCVARNVYEQARNRLPVGFAPMGRHRVKNIAEPVEAWRVLASDGSAGGVRRGGRPARFQVRSAAVAACVLVAALAAAALGARWLGRADVAWRTDVAQRTEVAQNSPKPSLAVLPLNNMSGDAGLDYFSDGLTEDLTTQLARFPELSVAARNSAFAYKGKAVDVKRIGKELGARYVLEGSVRRTGDRVRITAQLIDAETGHHVWADRFDEEGVDVFALQDRVVQKVAAAVAGERGRIRAAGYRQAWEKPSAELAEYDYFLRVHSLIFRFTRAGMEEARRVALEGLGRFPNSALIRIKLGWVDLQFARRGWSDDPVRDLGEAYRLAEEAMRATNLPTLARLHGHWLLAMLHGWYTHDIHRLEAETEAALTLAPGDPEVRTVLCEPHVLVGSAEKGLALVRSALDQVPALNAAPWPHVFLAFAYFADRRYEEAIAAAGKAGGGAPLMAAASHAALGRPEEARAALGEALAREPGLTLAKVRRRYPFRNSGDLDHLLESLRKAGLPGQA
jgi:adenylate cyclase